MNVLHKNPGLSCIEYLSTTPCVARRNTLLPTFIHRGKKRTNNKKKASKIEIHNKSRKRCKQHIRVQMLQQTDKERTEAKC